MSQPKPHNKPMSNSHAPSPRPPVGAPAQEAVGLHPRPDPLADARGNTPRKKTRSAIPGVEADARGNTPRKENPLRRIRRRSGCPWQHAAEENPLRRIRRRSGCPRQHAAEENPLRRIRRRSGCLRSHAPRKKTRSAVPGVEADARSHAPRKKTRPVGRGGRSRGRRPRRRSLALAANAGPSLPRLSPDSRDRDGEIALLRSLTNRLLSKRPLDHVQISRYLRILVRAISADSRMPRELTDQEQIDSLIRKVFHKSVNDGELNFYDLVPVRMARPGDKWWPWRELLPLEFRWRHGIIDPEERWPHEENEYLAEMEAMDRAMAESYLGGPLDEDEDPDEDPPSDYGPPPYEDPTPDDDDDEDPPTDDSLSVIPAPEPVEDAESAPLACAGRRESIPRNEAGPPTTRRTAKIRPRPP